MHKISLKLFPSLRCHVIREALGKITKAGWDFESLFSFICGLIKGEGEQISHVKL